MPQVALSTEFLKAFAAVPKQQQKKVRAFVEKFKADPTQSSINYEPISAMADPKVRTVRIGDDYSHRLPASLGSADCGPTCA